MLKLILPLFIFLGVAQASQASQPPLSWGPNNTTQTITPGLNLNGNVSLYSGTQDPSVTATIGVKGDLFVRYGSSGGKLFIKQDNGATTNWTYLFAGTPGTGTGDILHTGNSFGANITLGTSDNFNTTLQANGTAAITITPAQVNILQNELVTYGKSITFSDSGSNSVGIKAPATVTSSYSIILPTSIPSTGSPACLLISTTGQMSTSPCYSGISSVGGGTSLVSGSFNVKSLIGINNISIVDNGDGTISLGETNPHLPGTGTVQSVNLAVGDTATFAVSGGPISYSGVLQLNTMIQPANYFWAAPDGRNGTPIWRKGVIGDLTSVGQTSGLVMETDGMGGFTYQSIPGALPHVVTTFNTRDGDVTLLAADLGAVSAVTPVAHEWLTGFSSSGAFSLAQPAFSDISGKSTISQLSSATISANQVPVSDGSGNVNWGPLPVEAIITITSNYTAPASAEVIIAACTANCTISLPDISSTDGVILRIKNISAFTVSVQGNSSQLIDTNNIFALSGQYQAIDIVSKSGAWNVF